MLKAKQPFSRDFRPNSRKMWIQILSSFASMTPFERFSAVGKSRKSEEHGDSTPVHKMFIIYFFQGLAYSFYKGSENKCHALLPFGLCCNYLTEPCFSAKATTDNM